MRVYYDRHGQVTGYSTRGWERFFRWFWLLIFATALLGWPIAVVPGWYRWPAELFWLVVCLALFGIVRHGPGHRVSHSQEQVGCRPGPSSATGDGHSVNRPGPRDWEPRDDVVS